jgi:hypothetical protein
VKVKTKSESPLASGPTVGEYVLQYRYSTHGALLCRSSRRLSADADIRVKTTIKNACYCGTFGKITKFGGKTQLMLG